MTRKRKPETPPDLAAMTTTLTTSLREMVRLTWTLANPWTRFADTP
jgi:hypothetical protein